MVRILSRSDVQSVISMRDVIEAVEQAHADLARGSAIHPNRTPVVAPRSDTVLIPMTAALTDQGIAAVKLFTDVPSNPGRALPRQQSSILLVDLETGRCEAFLDGPVITQFRTAAASAVATRHLAREDSHVLGLIGAGALARTHVSAIAQVRPIDTVLVWSRSGATSRAFRHDMADRVELIEIVDSPEQVVRRADVLCTLTPSKIPVVHGDWFAPGLHINAVGAPPRTDHREIDTEGIRRSRVVVDSFDTALTESGDVLIPIEENAIATSDLYGEIGEIVIGTKDGRRADDEITLYNSIGLGIQDVATAGLVVRRANEKAVGIEVAITD